MIVICSMEDYAAGILLARYPVRKERGRHLSELINL